jgi:hypothetical protein
LTSEKCVVLAEALAESVAGVEDNRFGRDSGAFGGSETCGQALAHCGKERVGLKLRLRAPLLGPPARVREHHCCVKLGTDFGHARIPRESAHVIHDLRAGSERRARCFGFVRVD